MTDLRLQNLAAPVSLASFFADVRRRSQAPGVDGVTPEAYAGDLAERVERLGEALLAGTYRPSRLLRMPRHKPGGGIRQLSIPVVEDRIVLELLRHALEPGIERLLTRAAFAYRPGRSARAAVDAVLRRIDEGAAWVALADIREFFDHVRIDDVIEAAFEACADPLVLRLLESVLRGHARSPGRGLAQGSSLSPLLSNLALTPLDRRLLADGFPLVRYCDNLCVAAGDEATAHRALAGMRREAGRLGLSLKPEPSRVAPVRDGFTWLGFWLGPGGGRVGEGAVTALAARLDAAGAGLAGDALRARLLPIVRGWIQYFDTPLPDGAALGAHEALARSLLAECAAAPAISDGAAPESLMAPPAGDDDGDGWDDSGTPPEAPAFDVEQVDRLLREADRLAASGAYQEAEAAFEAAQQLARIPAPAAEAPSPAEPMWDDEAVDAFIGLFAAGHDAFETAPRAAGVRREFTAVSRPLAPADVQGHLAGKIAVAVRPRLPDGTTTLGVIDLDGRTPPASAAVLAHAAAIASVARSWGWSVLVESTGGRGAHVWIPVAARMRADDLAHALDALLREAGTPGDGVHIERLPGPDAAPDLHVQPMTLPLGVHLETGGRSRLSWGTGLEVAADLQGLFAGHANDASLFLQAALTEAGVGERPGPAEAAPVRLADLGQGVVKVMEGCALLRHLDEKAAAVGHLDHAERLSVLYSLGHLGAPGERAIHALIGRCQNYDAAETSRQIARMTGLPIGCTRMREKHATPELLPLCCCEFADVRRRGGYPTPVLHAIGFKRSWRDVLRGRRDAEARAREQGVPGVQAVREELPTELSADLREEPGVWVKGAPPHDWA
jgi:retron-type reverse transcriptase